MDDIMDDKISKIPDDILCYILSFLPTSDAVATSFLSSRWKYLWRSISKLTFDDSLLVFKDKSRNPPRLKERRFAYLVNEVLYLHNPHCALEEFYLKCAFNSKPYDFTLWISSVIVKGIKSLNLDVDAGMSFALPINFFNCGTLEVLQLKGCVCINVPNVCCIPKLRTMKLNQVRFQDSESFRRLISSATSLESFTVRGVSNLGIFAIYSSTLQEFTFVTDRWDNLNEFKLEIECPALRNLKVANFGCKNLLIPIEFLAFKTLQSLTLGGSIVLNSAAIICLPNLRELTLFDAFDNNIEAINKLISSCTSLVSLDINRIQCSSHVELKISSATLEVLNLSCYTTVTHKLVINAPALQYLSLWSCGYDASLDCKMEKISSLKNASIEIIEHGVGNYRSFDCRNIYQALENVESLSISFHTYKVLDFEHSFPVFRKLTVLKVICGVDILHEFIKKSTSLEDLKFTLSPSRLGDPEIQWKNPKSVPVCLLSSLKSTSICNFKGSYDERAIIEYVLENARIMETMEIHFDSMVGSKMKAGLRKRLLNFHRGQDKCKVIII